MTEKPKGSEIDPQRAVEQAPRRQASGTPGRRTDGDALDASGNVNAEKLRQNQQRLNVGADHKTEAMKKGKRGTYP